jgi:hypothetical protein
MIINSSEGMDSVERACSDVLDEALAAIGGSDLSIGSLVCMDTSRRNLDSGLDAAPPISVDESGNT